MAIVLNDWGNYIANSIGVGFNNGMERGLTAALQEQMRKNAAADNLAANKELADHNNELAVANQEREAQSNRAMLSSFFGSPQNQTPGITQVNAQIPTATSQPLDLFADTSASSQEQPYNLFSKVNNKSEDNNGLFANIATMSGLQMPPSAPTQPLNFFSEAANKTEASGGLFSNLAAINGVPMPQNEGLTGKIGKAVTTGNMEGFNQVKPSNSLFQTLEYQIDPENAQKRAFDKLDDYGKFLFNMAYQDPKYTPALLQYEQKPKKWSDPATGYNYEQLGIFDKNFNFHPTEEPRIVGLGKQGGAGGSEGGGLNLKDYPSDIIEDEKGNKWRVFYSGNIDPKTGTLGVLGRNKISDKDAETLRNQQADFAKTAVALKPVLNDVEEVITLYTNGGKNPEGDKSWTGLEGAFTPTWFPNVSEDETQFRIILKRLLSEGVQVMSGAAASDTERKFIAKWIPSENTSDKEFFQSINSLADWLRIRTDPKFSQEKMDNFLKQQNQRQAVKTNDDNLRNLASMNDF